MLKKLKLLTLRLLRSQAQKRLLLLWTFLIFVLSVALIPTGLVEVKMLPGKNNDTFSIYIDLPEGSSIEQTKKVCNCVANYIRPEKEVINAEVFLGMGSPMDFAGLIKGSGFKNISGSCHYSPCRTSYSSGFIKLL